MKSEKRRIFNEVDAIDRQLASTTVDYTLVVANLEAALDFVDGVGSAYPKADDTIRRGINQGIFKRIEIDPDGITRVQLTDLFEAVLKPKFVNRAVQAVSAVEVIPSSAGPLRMERSLQDVDRLWEMSSTRETVRRPEQTNPRTRRSRGFERQSFGGPTRAPFEPA